MMEDERLEDPSMHGGRAATADANGTIRAPIRCSPNHASS